MLWWCIENAFILSVIFMFFNNSNLTGYVISEEKKENSVLYTPVASLAPLVLPQVLAKFKSENDNEEEEPTDSSASI